jgi:ubiquinol oxidase
MSDNSPAAAPQASLDATGRQYNLNAIFGNYDEVVGPLSDDVKHNRKKLKALKLNTTSILAREKARGGIPPDVPAIIRFPYVKLCEFIDAVFEDRPVIERFFFLETVARMPYFSYVSMLHLYETLGFWRRGAETKRVHGDEEYNEYHHLLIMESLGGDQNWVVRFLAQPR